MGGLRKVTPMLKRYIKDKNKPIEMLHIFFSLDGRKKKLEIELINYLFEKARNLGYTSVCWDSGPRYKDTLWPIYKKHFGEPTVSGSNFYDNLDSMIWEVKL